MYLVCRPCSSSLFPSTSCLYPGLITTMISTDFWRNTFHHWSEFSAYRRQTGPWLEVHTSFRNLSIHLVVSIIRAVLSKMSICNETHSVSLWNIIGKQISWSHDTTYCGFKSLISQKFNKMDYFTGGVDWVCDENTSCETNAVLKILIGSEQNVALRPTAFLW